MLNSPIIIAYETCKKDRSIKVYAVFEEVLTTISRTVFLDNYSTPVEALSSLFKEDASQEKYAMQPFTLPHDTLFAGDKQELLTLFYKHDLGQLEDHQKFLNSVEVCFMATFGSDSMLDDIKSTLNNTRLLGGYRGMRRFYVEGQVKRAQ